MESGTLGNNSYVSENRPVYVRIESNDILTDIDRVSSRKAYHLLLLRKDGSIWGFGNNSLGPLGEAASEKQNFAIPLVSGANQTIGNISFISAGDRHSLLINESGEAYQMGTMVDFSPYNQVYLFESRVPETCLSIEWVASSCHYRLNWCGVYCFIGYQWCNLGTGFEPFW